MFVINWGDIVGRIDPDYYKKEYRDLEVAVSKITTSKLRDYVLYMAGGATPKTTESEKYYSEKENGIAFLRVQNLSPQGIQVEDCKYINEETHNGMLVRSKVYEQDLLTKITGVGRMAVSSVAPASFEGNINQHMVVIRTKNEIISKQIAAFLNSDVGEKLASRRSTGGTRPALDYTALRSIPIILDQQIVDIMDEAYIQKAKKEEQAKQLLDSINSYLLDELGIAIPPEEENILENRKFYVSSGQVVGNRFDPFYWKKEYRVQEEIIIESKYSKNKFFNIAHFENGVIYKSEDEREIGHGVLRANNLNLKDNTIDLSTLKYIDESIKFSESKKLYRNDIFICSASGSKEHAGKVAFIENDLPYYYGGFMATIRVFNSLCLSKYLFEYMASKIYRNALFRLLGGTNINNVNGSMLNKIPIILPPIDIQNRIIDNTKNIRSKAKQLEQEAQDIIKFAKQKVERILLKEEV